jgi:hypothetical protein
MMCVVVALSEDTRNRIAASLRSLGMDVISLASLADLPATLQNIPVGGILLDVTTSVKASSQDKMETQELLNLFPFAKFKMNGNELLILGKIKSLENFVYECQRFTPRTVRKVVRTIVYLAAHLSRDATFDDAEKVVTMNVSAHGCFVYSAREWSIDDRVWLRFNGSNAVVSGVVRSCQPWGNDKVIPGVGIKLDEASDQF